MTSAEAEATKSKINDYIDGLALTPDEYNIFLDLYENCSDKLFVRVMEALADDRTGESISPRDFHTVLGEFSSLGESLENQSALNREYRLMKDIVAARKMNADVLRNLIANQRISDGINPEDIERINVIMSELSKPSGDTINDIYRMKVLQKVMRELAGGDAKTAHAMLLSVDDYMLPVDVRYIKLNDFDRAYMNDNGLTEDDMIKLKSMAAFELLDDAGDGGE